MAHRDLSACRIASTLPRLLGLAVLLHVFDAGEHSRSHALSWLRVARRLRYGQHMGWFRDRFMPPREEPPVVAFDPAYPERREPANPYVSVKVTGEASYQDNLRTITGRRGREALKVEGRIATLVREPDNPFDPNAIRLEIDGLQVGYVPRTRTSVCGYRSLGTVRSSASRTKRRRSGSRNLPVCEQPLHAAMPYQAGGPNACSGL